MTRSKAVSAFAGVALTVVVIVALLAFFSGPILFHFNDSPKSSAGPDLEGIRQQAMYQFVPPQATVDETLDSPATSGGLFGQAPGSTSAGHSFRVTSSLGAALESFIPAAQRDGWTLTSRACDRTSGDVRVTFNKTAGQQMVLAVTASSQLRPGSVSAVITLGSSGNPSLGTLAQGEVADLNCTGA